MMPNVLQYPVATAAVLRAAFKAPRDTPADDLVRDLADYDRAFGIDGQAM